MTRPLLKICGVTRAEDAALAAELGADLIGLNFYPESPRFLTVERAAAVVRAVAGRARVAGVFVDCPPLLVAEIAERVGLDLLQFHGDEPPEALAPWGGRAIKVHRVEPPAADAADTASIANSADAQPGPDLLAAYPEAWGFLFDVRHPALFGGTGDSWSWASLRPLAASAAGRGRPLLVAGGIRLGNAARALAESGAAGLDVCSGVESAPGVKDPLLLRQLCAEVFDGSIATRS